VAQLEAEIRDTADAVDAILSHEEQKQATLQPEPMQMPEGLPQ
jgi:hypothetical protein